MKKIITLLICIAVYIFSFAQAPQKFNYQGVARGSSGNVFSNQLLGFKLSILQGSSTGTPVYVETQAVTSDSKGIFSLEVGTGTIVNGVFSSIGWGGNSYWLKTEMDTTGGSNYQFMGSTQMISVPYALYSETTGDTSLWKKNGNNIYRLNGNIGIGTTIPNTKLHVSNNSTNGILLTNASTGDASTSISVQGTASGSPNNNIGITVRRVGTDNQNILFRLINVAYNKGWDWKMPTGSNNLELSNIGTGTQLSVLDVSGNVGIGTTTPSQKLSVAGVIESTTGGIKFPDGTTQTTAAGAGAGSGFSNMQVFSTAGTYTFSVPAGVTKVMVEVWGGGGGNGIVSSSQGGGGGAGGYGKEIFSVTPSTTYTVIVGGGGAAQTNGSTSSFGILINAAGGSGTSNAVGGVGGTSSATFNVTGGEGTVGVSNGMSGHGGSSSIGSGGGGAMNGLSAITGKAPGGGGGGGCNTSGYTSGAGGGTGRVVVWW